MTNPFDDLDNGTDDSGTVVDTDSAVEPDDHQTVATEDQEHGTSSSEAGESLSAESTRPATEPDSGSVAADSGPAFEYSEVRQKPLYARDVTWTKFEKTLRTSIAPALAEQDVIDEETREIHDAVLRFANMEPERVAELVLEARRES